MGFAARLDKKRILTAALVFLIAYPLCLIVWVAVIKSHYGGLVGETGTFLAAATFKTSIETFDRGKEIIDIVHTKPILTGGGVGDAVIRLKLYISNFSFNMPLTLAIMFALLPIFHWRPLHFCEAIGLIVLVHLLFVYFFNSAAIYGYLVNQGVIEASLPKTIFWEFSWAFIDNMVIRFEPFLVIVYLWLRERKRSLQPKPQPARRRPKRR